VLIVVLSKTINLHALYIFYHNSINFKYIGKDALFDIFLRFNHCQFFCRCMDNNSRNLVQKVVEGHFRMGPVEKNPHRVHITCVILSSCLIEYLYVGIPIL
jgi:hypothetical protein